MVTYAPTSDLQALRVGFSDIRTEEYDVRGKRVGFHVRDKPPYKIDPFPLDHELPFHLRTALEAMIEDLRNVGFSLEEEKTESRFGYSINVKGSCGGLEVELNRTSFYDMPLPIAPLRNRLSLERLLPFKIVDLDSQIVRIHHKDCGDYHRLYYRFMVHPEASLTEQTLASGLDARFKQEYGFQQT